MDARLRPTSDEAQSQRAVLRPDWFSISIGSDTILEYTITKNLRNVGINANKQSNIELLPMKAPKP
jgi:hypothetical protein